MKKKFLLFALVLFIHFAQAQNFDNPGEYIGYIGKQQEGITKKYLSYVSAFAHGKRAKKIESLRDKLMDEVQEARMNISGMPSFSGDKSYRDTTVNFMKLYFNLLNDDYSKIINMEEVAEQSYDAMEAYFLAQEMVNKKLDEANGQLSKTQQDFAKNHNVNLVKGGSDIEDMAEQVSEMNKYHHDVYLIFFKPYKQEDYLLDAIQKGNITGIEQNKSSLLKYSTDGLTKLAAMKPFKGDGKLVKACTNLLKFYSKEVEKMGAVSDYFLAKEAFAKLQKDFEKKDDHTKDEVNAFNKAVDNTNKGAQNYNKLNEALFNERKGVMDEWNSAVETYFDEHAPHY